MLIGAPYIGGKIPHLYAPPPEPVSVSSEPKTPVDVWNHGTATEYINGGVRYGTIKTIGQVQEWWYDNKELPQVDIHKPVLFVQGFVAPPGQFATVLNHLTADGRNGGAPVYIQDGKFFSDPDCSQAVDPSADSKVFRLIHDPLASPEIIADKMLLAREAMQSLTGEKAPDVIAHSLGGLGARIFADRGNRLGKLAMVGSPNQGSRAAMLAKAALVNGISWATSLAHVTPAALPALEWMTPVISGNEKLESLNNRWKNQQEQLEDAIIFGVTGFQSPSSVTDMEPGDGLIESSSLGVGDLKVRTFEVDSCRKGHYTMVNDPEIFRGYSDFLGWTPVA